MDNRKYNIYFHTHTISGIIICAVLYVIFFAGSFSFFKDDIAAWQKNSSFISEKKNTVKDFNRIIDSLSHHHKLIGRNFNFTVQRHGMGAYVTMSPSMDSTLKKSVKPGEKPKEGRGRGGRGRGDGDSAYFTYDFAQQKQAEYSSSYDMGEFLYRLHFLAQLNVIPIRLGVPFGYLLAGVVAFIFLFALITGLLLHWDKIVSNFFVFRPFSKWKTVWTDLHTALGVIGFPFQFIFAVTGIVLIVNSFLIAPYTKFLYKDNSEKLYADLEYADDTKYAYAYKPLTTGFDLNKFVNQVEKKWETSNIRLVSVQNYQDANMHVTVTAKPDPQVRFSGLGKIIYRVQDQQVLYEKSPLENSTYVDKVKSIIYHLHFGDFGGRPLRVMFFVLGITGCIVIISGILIWLVARDKDNVPTHKRKFNFWTANIFLAICLSMLPVTAITMIALLFYDKPVQTDIYHWYFYSWLALSVYFIVRKNLTITNKQTLILSVITCFLVPVFHGIIRNNWIWNTFAAKAYDILFIDILFLSLAILSAIVLWKMRNKELGKLN
jgi:uncharacterized iron-regulated membrane protein